MHQILEVLKKAAREFAERNSWVEDMVVYQWELIREMDLLSGPPSLSLLSPERHTIWVGVISSEQNLENHRAVAGFGLSLGSERILVETRFLVGPGGFCSLLEGDDHAEGVVSQEPAKED